MTIRAKLIGTHVGISVVALTVMAIYSLNSFDEYFRRTESADIVARTAAISESMADALERDDIERVQVLARRYGAQKGVSLRVHHPDGRLMATSESLADDALITDWLHVPGVAEALAGK